MHEAIFRLLTPVELASVVALGMILGYVLLPASWVGARSVTLPALMAVLGVSFFVVILAAFAFKSDSAIGTVIALIILWLTLCLGLGLGLRAQYKYKLYRLTKILSKLRD